MEERRWEGDAEVRKILGRGWRLGAEDFLERLQYRIQSQLTTDFHGSNTDGVVRIREDPWPFRLQRFFRGRVVSDALSL